MAVPKTNAATKFQNAAHTTAALGDRTRVDTTVAMELAASWKPIDEIEREGDEQNRQNKPYGGRKPAIRRA